MIYRVRGFRVIAVRVSKCYPRNYCDWFQFKFMFTNFTFITVLVRVSVYIRAFSKV